MKYLAFLLCAGFIAYLLKFDRKLSKSTSSALWLPTLWLCVCASKPLGVWFGGADFFSGSAMDRNFLTLLFFAGLAVLLRRGINWAEAFRGNGWLMLLFLYMMASLFWSDIPFVSFKRWFRELVAITMALVVATDPAPRDAMQAIFRRTAYILIPLSLFLIRYVPALGVEFHRWRGERMWTGVTMQKNGLGRLCIICGFFLIWVLYRRYKGRDIAVSKHQTYAEVFLLGLTFWLLKGPGGAYPATAVVVLALGLGLYGYLLWKRDHREPVSAAGLTMGLSGVLVYGITLPTLTATLLSGFFEMLGRDVTFTGRTAIWANLIPFAEKQPLIGLGFGSFWTPFTRIQFIVGEAHNGYLDVTIGLGYLGLFLLCMFLIQSCRRAVRGLEYDFDWACFWLCLLFMTVLHNSTESSLNSFSSHLTALLVFFAFAFSKMAASAGNSPR